ncbi:4'-phosphopantetheinyl transferase [Kitasatospora sp. GAS204A]|uniref:4'-phosphopantetheinyl transferase family protein n=1 Tax=unclassified Kitasatospora TaxID=2633591 RepID=UPI002474B943|nr:4'-phosphopantetheinyl transferase superfamily protein [Kitasatospora sp. GAS204B]MDH6119061.1 4'-phosphopantetheinyl transferase [Kitasatospora sp. GAS204B]
MSEAAEVEVWLTRVAGQERSAARELVLRLVAERTGTPVGRLRLGRAASGRLVIEGVAGVAVSVSRLRGVVAVAAGDGVAGVGVAVEWIRPLAHGALARRWFPAAEAAWVAGQHPDQRSAALLWLWTRKEALAKAVGQGLGGGTGLLRPVGAAPSSWPPGPCSALPIGSEPGSVAWPVTEDLMLAVAAHGAHRTALTVRQLACGV